MRADRDTDRHTDTLTAILNTLTGDDVIITQYLYSGLKSWDTEALVVSRYDCEQNGF